MQDTENYNRRQAAKGESAFKKRLNRLLLFAVVVVVVLFITSISVIVNNA